MPIDLSQIKKKLQPVQDGQDTLRLRTGVVSAVNANGTVDVVLSGVTMTNLPRLSESVVGVDEPVQILSYRGSLLVIGGVAPTDAGIGQQPFVRDASTSSSSAVTAETVVMTLPSRTYKSGRAYEIWVGGGVAYQANSQFSAWNVRKGTTTAGTQVIADMRHTNGAATSTLSQHLNLRATFRVTGADVTTQLVLTAVVNGSSPNTVTHVGASNNPRHFTVVPAGFASAWTNAAVLS